MLRLKSISNELAMILNLRNVAIDHKMNCHVNCNVSLFQLKDTAKYLSRHISDTDEQIQAATLIAEMPLS